MPKNKWKITKTSLTKKPVLSKYNEYIDLESIIEDILKCKGLDLCTYQDEQTLLGAKWKKDTFTGVDANGTKTLTSTIDTTHAYLVFKYNEADDTSLYTNATATGTTLTITDYVGPDIYTYVIFYKATA